MFYRFFLNNRIRFAFFVCLFFLVNIAKAQTDSKIDPISIEIENAHGQLKGHPVTVSVTLTNGSTEIEEFDFSIRYNAKALTFFGVTKGELFDMPGSYEWEYSSYRLEGTIDHEGSETYRTLRIIGKADRDYDTHQPNDLLIPNGMILAEISFIVTYNRHYDCHYIPISFYWNDCHDNVIRLVDTLEVISNNVFDVEWNNITDNSAELPSLYGTPDICLDSFTAERAIDLKSGGVDIICHDGISSNGDMNINNVYYEISDAVVYNNYFIYGLSAFTINVEGQIFQSDINADGLTLTNADLQYLLRVITGMALNYP